QGVGITVDGFAFDDLGRTLTGKPIADLNDLLLIAPDDYRKTPRNNRPRHGFRDRNEGPMGGVIEFPKERPQIRLPKIGRAESQSAREVGSVLGALEVGFRSNDHVVEIQEEPFDGELDKFKLARGGLKFKELHAARAKTWLEQHVETGLDVE